MKTKRLLSVVLTLCMVFSMFTVLTLTSTVALAEPATATTKALYVGPSTRYTQVPSGLVFPLEWGKHMGGGNDWSKCTKAEFTAKIKMLSGTKPYIGIYRVRNSSGTFGSFPEWVDNENSYFDSDGIFHCDVYFQDVPGSADKCFYSDIWDGDKQTRKTDIPGRNTPIWAVFHIGNMNHEDDTPKPKSSESDFSDEFVMSDAHLVLKRVVAGSLGESAAPVGTDLAPSTSDLDEGKLYSFVGNNGKSGDTDAHNHPFNAELGKWSAFSTDEDTVRQVTVADDLFDGETHSYTKHAETDYELEYYTCPDFGDTKFEKFGNCYSVLKNNDSAKKAFVIKSHAGDTVSVSDGLGTYANIFIPLNTHKWYSAFDSSNCTSTSLTEANGRVRVRVQFTAKRLSGTGQPTVGRLYAYAYVKSSSEEPKMGAPNPHDGKDAYNNNCGSSYGLTDDKDSSYSYIGSSYDPATGEFIGDLSLGTGYYKQLTRHGVNEYITIGLAEHDSDTTKDAASYDSSFIISNIRITPYAMGDDNTVKFDGKNQAPKMSAANCDANTRYKYLNYYSGTDKLNGTLDVAMRHAPINKFSVEGAVQNVSLIDVNDCNKGTCTLEHHAATDTTVEYWSCATHNKNYDDMYASHELSDITATKKMITINATAGESNDCRGAFITLDNDGWVGNKYFIFKCKMKTLSGSGIPRISVLKAGYYGNGTVYEKDWTSMDDQDGTNALWTHYDPITLTYTAAFKIERHDPHDSDQLKYYESTTGAHTALLIGNFTPNATGAYGSDVTTLNQISDTAFSFAEPEIYAAVDSAAGTYTGDNLCAPITDKTNTFETAYHYNNCTQINGAGEYADREPGSVITAPIGKWSRNYYDDNITLADIPDGYFEPAVAGDAKMLKMAGYGSSSSAQAILHDTVIASSTTYRFDMDCRAFGGTYIPKVILSEKQEGGTFGAGEIVDFDTFNGYHYTYQFTTAANLAASGNNFRLQIGLSWDARNTSSMYIANVQVREVLGGDSYGDNILQNGDFAWSTVGKVTADNVAAQMLYWNGYSNLLKYDDVEIMSIPDGFFDADNNLTGREDIALKSWGGDWPELQFKTELKADKYYRLSFNYRDTGVMPGIEIQSKGTVTLTKKSVVSGGKYVMTYELYSASDNTKYDNKNPNTRIRFRFEDSTANKVLYINNVQLYELDGADGNIVGANEAGNLNAIYDDSYYSGLVNAGDSVSFKCTQDSEENISRVLANGWFGSTRLGTFPTDNAQLVKLPDNFFNYKTPEQRFEIVRKVLLGESEITDTTDLHYDPNGDGTLCDIKDIVCAKHEAIKVEGELE
ncbi:MAG: hypothetical protein J5659_00560 [Clostridia bacterium]|nr:hypothetical protein [Clostridia bacterium]